MNYEMEQKLLSLHARQLSGKEESGTFGGGSEDGDNNV